MTLGNFLNLHNAETDTALSEQIRLGNADALLTPRQLTENLNRVTTPGFVPYERPITITDSTAGAQYKIIFSGGTLSFSATLDIMDTGWQTKDDLHSIIEDGIHVDYINPASYDDHDTEKTINFTIHKKLYTGTEQQMGNGQLTYKFLTSPRLWHIKPNHLSYNASNDIYTIGSVTETEYDGTNNPTVDAVLMSSVGNYHETGDRLLYKTLTGDWIPQIAQVSIGGDVTTPVTITGLSGPYNVNLLVDGGIQNPQLRNPYSSFLEFKHPTSNVTLYREMLNTGTSRASQLQNRSSKSHGPLIFPRPNFGIASPFTQTVNLVAYTQWGVKVVHNVNISATTTSDIPSGI